VPSLDSTDLVLEVHYSDHNLTKEPDYISVVTVSSTHPLPLVSGLHSWKD